MVSTHKATSLLFLDEASIRGLLTMEETISLMEQVFKADALGQVATFPVVRHFVPPHDGSFVIKSGLLQIPTAGETNALTALGLKAGSYWKTNLVHGIPNHNAAMMMLDVETGCPTAILAANTITTFRTAAGAAVAAMHAARPIASLVTIVGAGEQAHVQLEALRLVVEIRAVIVWARNREAARQYAAAWSAKGVPITAFEDLKEAVADADIIVTTTPAVEPLLFRSWIRPGTHINAVGSDASGKQELSADLVAHARIIADKRIQSLTIGEMQQPVATGLVDETHIAAELGEVCAGLVPGRLNDEQVTIFDSSGVSFQDLVVAEYLVRRATEQHAGQMLRF
jgi:alanine dehydrogenase